MNDLFEELRGLLNRYSCDGDSNTPDFILVNYLIGCLNSYKEAVKDTAKWFGNNPVWEES